MFNNYSYGGYLIYALDGRNKVFIDGRTDIYDQAGVLTDYGRIRRVEPIALRLLDVYSVQSCLIERNEALGTLLAASPRWQKVYADGQSALFVRKGQLQRGEQRRFRCRRPPRRVRRCGRDAGRLKARSS